MFSRLKTSAILGLLGAMFGFGSLGPGLLAPTSANEGAITRAADPPDTPVDIEAALRSGRLEAKSEGSGLSAIVVVLKRVEPHRLRVIIPVGTFFMTDGTSQNMIGTKQVVVDLREQRSARVVVAAACTNFHQPEPEAKDRFTIRSAPQNKELRRLMAVIARRQPSEVVVQVAIWVVTDDVSRSELDATYQVSFVGGLGGQPASTNADIDAARKLLEEAGIDTTRKRLFRK
jgi:hypothetical protein